MTRAVLLAVAMEGHRENADVPMPCDAMLANGTSMTTGFAGLHHALAVLAS